MDPYRQSDPEVTLAEARAKAKRYRAEWRRAKEALHEERRLEQEAHSKRREPVVAFMCLLFGGIAVICGMFVWGTITKTRAAEQAVQNPNECDLQVWRLAEKPAPCACYADTPMRDVPFRCTEKK